MKKILMLLQSEFPPDIRLEKEIKTLYNNNYEVLLVCNSYKRIIYPEFNYCKVSRLNPPFRNYKFNKLVNFPLFLNPRLFFKMLGEARKFKPDFIHVHDLPMMPIGLVIGWFIKKPVIFDMHENYPAAIKAFKKRGFLNFLFKNPSLAGKLEKFCSRKADRILVVIEENRDRLVNKYNLSPGNIYIVSNTVDLDTFNESVIDESVIKRYGKRFVILYTGWISPERGLETPILAMNYLKKKLPESLLLLVGDGISVPELKHFVSVSKLENYVEFVPWCGHQMIRSYMLAANVGILAHPVEDFINTTITHKLFEYMSQRLPVLVPDSLPFKRIINETNAGKCFSSENNIDFAEKVLEIAGNKSTDYGKNGITAVEKKYNWQNDSKRLLEMYQGMNFK